MWHNQDYKIINDSLGGIIKAINNLNKTLAYTNKILSDQQKPQNEVKETKDDGWISVDDRLPGVDQDWVFVKIECVANPYSTIPHNDIDSPVFVSRWDCIMKKWRSPFIGSAWELYLDTVILPYKVTHWKPIDDQNEVKENQNEN